MEILWVGFSVQDWFLEPLGFENNSLWQIDELILAFGIYNVWIINYTKGSKYRGGKSTNMSAIEIENGRVIL